MQINGISKVTPGTTAEWTAAQSKFNAPPSANAASTASGGKSPVLTQDQKAASFVQVTTIAATYSTTLAGTSYPGSVVESGGTFIASVPNPPGITASGLSVQSAEYNLDIKLDTLA
jgi:hypothetical protein